MMKQLLRKFRAKLTGCDQERLLQRIGALEVAVQANASKTSEQLNNIINHLGLIAKNRPYCCNYDNNRADIRIETVTGYQISGWAWIPSDPSKKLSFRLIGDNNTTLLSVEAEAYREDLHLAGIGDGAYSFHIQGKFSGVKAIEFLSDGKACGTPIPIDIGLSADDDFLFVHPDDFILKFCVNHPSFANDLGAAIEYYIRDGKDSADKLRQLCIDHFGRQDKLRLFEFAAGYGRVTRYLDNNLFDITACDIHEEALEYINNQMNAKTLLSASDPDALVSGLYDVVFALSFFSHIPDKTFGTWLKALYRQVAPGGVLIFTTHGRVSNETIFKYKLTDGYAFVPESEQGDISTDEYGMTVSEYMYVEKVCKEYINTAPSEWHEGFWWKHQDVYVVRKDGR